MSLMLWLKIKFDALSLLRKVVMLSIANGCTKLKGKQMEV
jgi:hypothetical protein